MEVIIISQPKKHRCSFCGRKTKKQFNDLRHCSCGKSYIKRKRHWQSFERTSDMAFCLDTNNKSIIKRTNYL